MGDPWEGSGRMNLPELARIAERLAAARAAEEAALADLGRIVAEAEPENRNLKLAAKLSGTPRTTVRRRMNAALAAQENPSA